VRWASLTQSGPNWRLGLGTGGATVSTCFEVLFVEEGVLVAKVGLVISAPSEGLVGGWVVFMASLISVLASARLSMWLDVVEWRRWEEVECLSCLISMRIMRIVAWLMKGL
jgi:hypothetical protein